MNKEQTGIKTKAKIIIGFGLALIAIVIGSYLTLKSVTNLSYTIDEIASPNTKSILLKDIINDLSDAESAVRAYSITKQDHYLEPFYDLIASIENKMNNVRHISENDPSDIAKLDTINNLIGQKLEILGEYIKIENDSKVEQAVIALMEKLEADTQQSQPLARQNEPKLQDLEVAEQQRMRENVEVVEPREPVQQEQKKNLFQKLKGIFSKEKEAEKIQPLPKREIRNIPVQPVPSAKNEPSQPQVAQQNTNIKKDIQEVIKEFELSNSDEQFEYKQDLVMQDRAIMDKIRGVIGRMERRDMASSEAQAAASIQSANNTIRNIMIFSIISLIIAVVFIYTLIVDITRTYKYRAALQKAKNAAEQTAKAKEEFLANMSHEIRTPLTAIIGFTDQLHYTPLDEEQDKYVEHVKQSSNHLLTIVNDILDFSKLESGNFKMEAIPFDPKKIINEVIEVLQPLANKKDIYIEHKIDLPLNLKVMGDPVRFRQIIINLINNAIKFTSDGGVTVICTATEATEANVVLNTAVKDTGIGIPKDKIDTIFQMFNQADTSISRKFGGTGLGLSISKKLVELHNGTIKVESEEGNGSTFSFEIPFPIATKAAIEAEDEGEITFVLPKGIKVLLAEDDPFMQQLLITTLLDLGIDATLAENGKVALNKLEEKHFEVILMDIQMPEMSGIEALQSIRGHIKKGIADKPVIAITANLVNGKENELKEYGFDDVIGKPFKKEVIVKTIAAVLKRKKVKVKPDNVTEDKISLTYLHKEAGGNDDFVQKMVELFIQNTTTNLAILKKVTDNNNFTEAGKTAHKMAPSFRHLGLDDLADKLKKVEQLSLHKEENHSIPQLVEDIIKRTEKVLSLLAEEKIKTEAEDISKA